MLKVGDVVVAKGSDQKMTVEGISTLNGEIDQVNVVYFDDDDQPHRGTFRASDLKVVTRRNRILRKAGSV